MRAVATEEGPFFLMHSNAPEFYPGWYYCRRGQIVGPFEKREHAESAMRVLK